MTTASALGRLRSANPFPDAPVHGDEALFERITALPPDARLARRPRRRAFALALAVALVVVLASTAFTFAHWVLPSIVGPSVTKKEYRRAQHELVLPPGYSWPMLHVPANTVTSRGAGGGHAVLAAENAWQCYWVRAIRTNDVAAQRRARAELTRLLEDNVVVAPIGAPEDWTPTPPPAGPYAIFAHDGGYRWLQQTYALAATGHPQRLIDSCLANKAG